MSHTNSITSVLLFCFILSVAAPLGFSQDSATAGKAKRQRKPAPSLVTIADHNAAGKLETLRTDFKFSADGRRLGNRVLNEREKRIATEQFVYDQKGRLKERRYLEKGAGLKWKWVNFRYDSSNRVSKHDIVNSKGKKIGWYRWTYDKQGVLKRRDRFNTDSSLKFYYSQIKLGPNQTFSTWMKFDGKGRKIGTKKWTYEITKKP